MKKILKNKRASVNVGKALKVITATVSGAALLCGIYVSTQGIVLPKTNSIIESVYNTENVAVESGPSALGMSNSQIETRQEESDNYSGITLELGEDLPEDAEVISGDIEQIKLGYVSGATLRIGDYYYKYGYIARNVAGTALEIDETNPEIDETNPKIMNETNPEVIVEILRGYNKYWQPLSSTWGVKPVNAHKANYSELYGSLYGIKINLQGTFYKCDTMTTLPKIPNTVDNLNGICCGCVELTDFGILPNNITGLEYAFNGCKKLTSVVKLPDSLQDAHCAFTGCQSLVRVESLPDNLPELKQTFSYCSSLNYVGNIPAAATSLEGAFYGCGFTESPEIPSRIKSLNSTFEGCTHLKIAGRIDYGVLTMEDCFKDCVELETVPRIPGSVQTMKNTFSGCVKLTTVPNIPAYVTDMTKCFYDCVSLRGSIEINANPSSGNKYYCFDTRKHTSILNNITITGFSTVFIPENTVQNNGVYSYIERDNKVLITDYIATGGTPVVPGTINGKQVYINTNAFKSDQTITDVSFENGVIYIDDCMERAFYQCRNLKTVTNLPDNVKSMHETFDCDSSLTSVSNIPMNIIYMENTFASCSLLTSNDSWEFPNSLINASHAFSHCTSITSLPDLPLGMLATDFMCAFTGITSFDTVPISVKYLNSMFSDCADLTGVITIDASPVGIYEYMFRNTVKNIQITGLSDKLDAIAIAANNRNVAVSSGD